MRDSLAVSVGIRPASLISLPPSVWSPYQRTETSKGINSVDVHGTASTDSLTATPPESQGGINFILDADQGIEHHGTRLVQIQSVRLHARLRGGLIRVPAINVERLNFCILARLGLLDCRGLGLWDCGFGDGGEAA